MALKNKEFWQSKKFNNWTFNQYYNRLTELAISRFEWKNLPPTIDARFLELVLFSDGMTVFFKDDVVGYAALRTMIGGRLNIYQIPTIRHAYAANGVNVPLDENNSVIIFNNLIHTNSLLDVEMYAERLYKLDRIIDVNTKAQKTPILVQCAENERLTMKNLYSKYDGDEPVIFGDKGLNPKSLTVFKTDAPYVSDKLYNLKTQYWNEALTYLGIYNLNITKKERVLSDEVNSNLGGTISSRYSALTARKYACTEINRMFGLNIDCEFREDYQVINNSNINKNDNDNINENGGDNNE